MPGAQKDYPSIPIILLTARDDMTTRAAAMDLGVSEFVAKPVNNRDLLDRVRVQLRNLEWDKTADQAFWRIEKSTRGAGREAIGILSTISTLRSTPWSAASGANYGSCRRFRKCHAKIRSNSNLIAHRESATIHWQIDSVYKIGLI